MASSELHELYEHLIHGSHILHHQAVVDAYGHLSARHPDDPTIFIMSGSMAPGTVSSPADLIHYHVENSEPVDPNAKKGFQERFIHSEIYKKYPEVMSVVHSHSENVLPFAMGSVEMKPCFHIAGFLGDHVPVYDIEEFYPEDALHDMLVNTEHLGHQLACKFSSTDNTTSPDHNVVVMSHHGFTTFGKNVQQAVYRAVYTHVNAGIQAKSLMLHAAAGKAADIKYLNAKQTKGCSVMCENTQGRPWDLWVKEVEAHSLYVNEAARSQGLDLEV